jgi:peptide/nickel transport system substrate-binding protein
LIKLAAVLTAFGLIAAACGGGSNGGAQGPSGSEFNKGENPVFNPGTPTKGGTMKWASVGDVDYMDPGAAYTVSYFAYIAHGTLRMLTTYPGTPELSEQTQVVPDLATDLGEPSDGNKTWTYHLKDGIKFGPALGGQNVPGVTGEEITSQDIKYAIERLFIPSVGAGYATYYEMIEGVDEFKKANAKGGPIKGEISGIETPDDKTIVFHLTRAVGDWDLRVSMPGTSPVPQDFAQKYDSQKDSDYDSHVVFSGPYYVASYTPQEHVLLKRNTEWDPATDDVRKAYVDQVDWKQGFENSVCVQKVLDNDYDTAVDCDPEGAQLQKVVTQPDYKKRFFNGLEPCTGYVFLNTTVEPFDDIKVRQAVNYAVDRGNLLKILAASTPAWWRRAFCPRAWWVISTPTSTTPSTLRTALRSTKRRTSSRRPGSRVATMGLRCCSSVTLPAPGPSRSRP